MKKRQRILGSLTNLIEIDLLRSFKALPILADDIQSDYRILISRDRDRPEAELYAFNLKDALPSFSLPLRSDDIEPTVNLQQLFTEILLLDGRAIAHPQNRPEIAQKNTNRVFVKSGF